MPQAKNLPFCKTNRFIPSMHTKEYSSTQRHAHTCTRWTVSSNCPPTPPFGPTSLYYYFPFQAFLIPVPMEPSQSFYPY